MAYYDPPPAERFAYDTDGTMVTGRLERSYRALTATEVTDFNSDGIGASANSGSWKWSVITGSVNFWGLQFNFVFPEIRTLSHIYLSLWSFPSFGAWEGLVDIEVSTDSTNGQDGSWSKVATSIPKNTSLDGVTPMWREDLVTLETPAENITSARLHILPLQQGGLLTRFLQPKVIHLWGGYGTEDRLDIVSSGGVSLPPEYWDWEDVQPGNILTKAFKVKNLSSTKTANNVQLTRDALKVTSPSFLLGYEFSSNGGSTWVTSLALGNLGPGELSSEILIRKSTPLNLNPGLHSLRVKATAGSWT